MNDDIVSYAEHEAIRIIGKQEPEPSIQKVLIVDDDRSMREMLSGILDSKGIHSLLAENAADAMDLLKSEKLITLVITDLRMLPIDGLAFIRQIRNSVWADLPIVVVSGDAGIRDAIDAMHLGIVDFLLKPIEPEQLLPLVNRELGIKA
ncbi:Response regulator MprA [compost metagenome]|uniref:response regulator n=1 Tax=unclassified Pseudomonas TaxID=196821 RepID=UPI000C6EEDD7|nr:MULTISPECIES: response regulator [unclassified Pseudomonas]QYX47744.1 response regulator [Pseudomonas sp. S11A 273]